MVDDARVPEQEVAMINKVLFATMAVVLLVASAAVAASLTERMEMDRMTVLKVDRVHARNQRRQLTAIVIGVDDEPGRQPAAGKRSRDRVCVVTDNNDHIVDAGAAKRSHDPRKECVAGANRQRRFRTSHARRAAGREHDRGDHGAML